MRQTELENRSLNVNNQLSIIQDPLPAFNEVPMGNAQQNREQVFQPELSLSEEPNEISQVQRRSQENEPLPIMVLYD